MFPHVLKSVHEHCTSGAAGIPKLSFRVLLSMVDATIYWLRQIQCRHLICAQMRGQPEQNTPPHARLSTWGFPGMAAWMTSQLNIALNRKLHGSLMCLAYFFDKLSMGVCTTRYWQTSGRLVQELYVRTVALDILIP